MYLRDVLCVIFYVSSLLSASQLRRRKNIEDGDGSTAVYAAGNVQAHNTEDKLDAILKELKKTRDEITKTRDEIREMVGKMRPKVVEKCSDRKDYLVHNCGNSTGPYKHYYVVDGDYNDHNRVSGICRVISPRIVGGKSYKLSFWDV